MSLIIEYFNLMLFIAENSPSSITIVISTQITSLRLMMSKCHLIFSIVPFYSTITIACDKLIVIFWVPTNCCVWISAQS